MELERFETLAVALRSGEPMPAGRFTVSHYRAVHRHLFQDVYAWAGQFRHVRMAKGGNMFCYPEYIDRELRRAFVELRQHGYLRGRGRGEFASDAARFLARVNAIHPFREGNGRIQLAFLLLLAVDGGHRLDLERLQPQPFLNAMIASFVGDEAPLRAQLFDLADAVR